MSQFERTSFLSGTNATFIAELYERYLRDPNAVDPSWRGFFADLADQAPSIAKELAGPGWGNGRSHVIANGHGAVAGNGAAQGEKALNGHAAEIASETAVADLRATVLDSLRAVALIRAYRVQGHLIADLDPLGIVRRTEHPDLDPVTYGFAEHDRDRPIFVNGLLGFETATLTQIIDACRATYCGHVGVEFMHIQELEQRQWIQARIEVPRNQTEFTTMGKRAILERLTV